uniref:PTB domain-containing engulfment adapter protein 1 isoform X2 n=1 Tax=Ciona intestinalis TaxID=7719 RepID=UPI000180BAD5|nr:PTB domain-containing engulfment adapter protein 1 isoform X2 [Ciona intestinalis]|eukprot:XP_026693934.1 PTB domain-containing engulfment adapter protein 1 isoform X2 [Ciona intestinalis]
MVLGPNKWIHQDTTLLNHKVVYIAKFIGVIEASGPRGMAVVREAIQKLKFSHHIKHTEGNKAAKVELSINVHGLIITDVKTKGILHNIPLERVSFCADDKQDPRLFSFIARADDGKHYCYGLDSQHEANHITLAIGQSFQLAYTSVIKSDEGGVASKQVMDLNKRIQDLEKENFMLKHRISELEKDSIAQKENKSLEYTSHYVPSTPVVPVKDEFDMLAFLPPKPTLVKPSSPLQGNQTARTSKNLSASNSPTYHDTKNLLETNVDSIGDFMKLNEELNRFNEGFSKGLTMQEAESSLDAFDPLKLGK